MLIVRTLLLLAFLTAQPALAETLSTATGLVFVGEEGGALAKVQSQFGEPANRHAAVGDPPITRWDYPQFAVYFEHDRVLHAVLTR